MIKTILLTIVLLCSMVVPASAWECFASSDTGAWGVGYSSSRDYAASIALQECRMRTPRWGYCSIDYCDW